MSYVHRTVQSVTEQIITRSRGTRGDYLSRMKETERQQPERTRLSCGNLAHGFAACESTDKDRIRMMNASNIGIVTAYNDMLSAHQPYVDYPERIKGYVREMGCTAQVGRMCLASLATAALRGGLAGRR